jgi:hypothetical protein
MAFRSKKLALVMFPFLAISFFLGFFIYAASKNQEKPINKPTK